MIPTVSRAPISSDPTSAPQRLPRPPITTTTKHSMMTSVPTPGKTVRAGPATRPPEEGDRPLQKSRLGDRLVLRPEDDLGQVVDDEHQGVGEQELIDLFLDVDAPQETHLQDHPDEGDPEGRPRPRQDESAGARYLRRNPEHEIRPEHIQCTVGEVQDVEHPEDQGQPRRYEEQECRQPQGG